MFHGYPHGVVDWWLPSSTSGVGVAPSRRGRPWPHHCLRDRDGIGHQDMEGTRQSRLLRERSLYMNESARYNRFRISDFLATEKLQRGRKTAEELWMAAMNPRRTDCRTSRAQANPVGPYITVEALFCWSVSWGISRDCPQGDWVETHLTPNPLPTHVHPNPVLQVPRFAHRYHFHGNCKDFVQVNTARLNIALNKNTIFIGTIIPDFK
jgi:hypothetical protein